MREAPIIPIVPITLTCPTCGQVFLTALERGNHHLEAHERPLCMVSAWVARMIEEGKTTDEGS
jgi:hypothetical protein